MPEVIELFQDIHLQMEDWIATYMPWVLTEAAARAARWAVLALVILLSVWLGRPKFGEIRKAFSEAANPGIPGIDPYRWPGKMKRIVRYWTAYLEPFKLVPRTLILVFFVPLACLTLITMKPTWFFEVEPVRVASGEPVIVAKLAFLADQVASGVSDRREVMNQSWSEHASINTDNHLYTWLVVAFRSIIDTYIVGIVIALCVSFFGVLKSTIKVVFNRAPQAKENKRDERTTSEFEVRTSTDVSVS